MNKSFSSKLFIFDNRNIYCCSQGKTGPVVYWLYKVWDNCTIKSMLNSITKAGIKQDFLLIMVEVKDWNAELSPWYAEGIEKGVAFLGNG